MDRPRSLYGLGFSATVCKTDRPTLSVRCPVCNVRALWPNGWTDQDKTWHAFRPRPCPHFVRWESSSPSPKGAQPPIFGPYPLRPNGCMDQDATWYGGRPRPRRLCVRWSPLPLPNKGAECPQFSTDVYCGQRAGWIKMVLGIEVGLSPGDFVLDGNPAPLFPKRGPQPPNVWPMVVAKRLDGSRWHLARRKASAQATLC